MGARGHGNNAAGAAKGTDGAVGETEFVVNEEVLCFHGPLLYNAKCISVRNVEENGRPAVKYRVHYKGWNKNWDEWVPPARMKKLTQENLAFCQQLIDNKKAKDREAKERKLMAKQASDAEVTIADDRQKTGSGVRPGAKRRRVGSSGVTQNTAKGTGTQGTAVAATVTQQPQAAAGSSSDADTGRTNATTAAINGAAAARDCTKGILPLPEKLRKQLVDDWNFVVVEKRLVPLPRKDCSIKRLLQKFMSESAVQGAQVGARAKGVAHAVEEVFNAALGSVLLYPFERNQYAEMLEAQPRTPLSEIFGMEHLIRLLVVLPEQLDLEKIEPENELVDCLRDFVAFLEANADEHLTEEYEMAAPDYMRAIAAHGKG
eukprot:m.1578729 g.1578729  ORF g.1578729 m.1578729 type:complete len:374 (+) comp25313_c0_seq7:287-1408(+)